VNPSSQQPSPLALEDLIVAAIRRLMRARFIDKENALGDK